jgi:hypothetical protein
LGGCGLYAEESVEVNEIMRHLDQVVVTILRKGADMGICCSQFVGFAEIGDRLGQRNVYSGGSIYCKGCPQQSTEQINMQIARRSVLG